MKEKDERFTPFTKKELDLLYASCISYGDKLFEIAKEIPNEFETVVSLKNKAKESYNMAAKIAEDLNN